MTCQNPLYKQCPQLREKNRNSQQGFKKKTLKHHAQQLKGLFSLFSSLLHKNFDHKLKYNNWLWFTFLLLAKVGEGRTLKNESSLPCVDPWRAFTSFFVPDRILSSLRMTKIKNYFWEQVHLIRRTYKDCIKKFDWNTTNKEFLRKGTCYCPLKINAPKMYPWRAERYLRKGSFPLWGFFECFSELKQGEWGSIPKHLL